MIVEIRLYKRYDTDLLSLYYGGYSIPLMMRAAVSAYANGIPLCFRLDEIVPLDMNDKKNVHTNFTMPESDVKACELLKKVRRGFRNTFCKAVLRNCMTQLNLACFFNENDMMALQGTDYSNKMTHGYSRAESCNAYRSAEKQLAMPFAGQNLVLQSAPVMSVQQFNSYQPQISAPQRTRRTPPAALAPPPPVPQVAPQFSPQIVPAAQNEPATPVLPVSTDQIKHSETITEPVPEETLEQNVVMADNSSERSREEALMSAFDNI